ncbi:ABC transporter ATP-binding protein [Prosthecomicrobium hirschii]|uniref:ABC transporter ATP-binding protein n=1 Tax=Prosthecodimorpha hirschii TaxID=665126 RepID=UPI00112E03B7|nr:ABC transporter ATP-binding protein [Prosthecomicrobium hirschii]TPQ50014.1 ABC transporter ATP-binding protein [Prosthecomicrobium hirschii]
MTAILSVEGVDKSYGTHHILKSVSLTVEDGETFAVIGPNGAGKTTLFKVMTGEIGFERGRIVYDGRDVSRAPAHERARLGMGRTFQVARIFPDVTVADNLTVAVEARRRSRGESAPAWYRVATLPDIRAEVEARLLDVGLADKAAVEAKFLSHGDKKRLEFGIALAGRPRILMLDEPTAGMSPTDRIATADLIARLRAETGLTVVMTEHDMDVIFGLADRILVMNYGEIIAVGSIEEVRANPLVREVYLGQEIYHAER